MAIVGWRLKWLGHDDVVWGRGLHFGSAVADNRDLTSQPHNLTERRVKTQGELVIDPTQQHCRYKAAN